MQKRPFFYAGLATVYIVLIVSIIRKLGQLVPQDNDIITPMLVLGLFVLSAAIMAYLFLSEPFFLYADGKKKEAVSFFLKTVACFSLFVLFFLFLVLII